MFPLLIVDELAARENDHFHRQTGNSAQRVRNSKEEDLQINESSDAEEGYISVTMFTGNISFVSQGLRGVADSCRS